MRNLQRLLAATFVLVAVIVAAAVPASAPAAGKITNGSDTGDALYASHLRPLVALIYASADDQWDGQFCAGTLIDDTHVLTAGHCIVNDEDVRSRQAPSSILVFAGSKKLNTTTMDRANLVGVDSIFVNPNFNIRTMRWDAAILRLSRPITNVPVMPRLTEADVQALGMGTQEIDSLVAGWGDTNPARDDCCFPNALKSVSVPIHSTSTCADNLANAGGGLSFDPEFQFCAGRLSAGGHLGADTCQGDSGGPLIVDVNGVPKHAGVTSFGVGCGQRSYGIYARTSALEAWINSIPGVVEGDTRDATHGPGDTAAPTVTAVPLDFKHARLTITPAASGTPVSRYTVWARDGAARDALDIFRGTATSLTFDVALPPVNSNQTYNVLVRPNGDQGDGPSASVRTRPVIDSAKPSTPTGVRVARSGAFIVITWNRSVDRQSGVAGYAVQKKTGGVWRAPQVSIANRLRIRVGASTHGSVRVLAVDNAENPSGYSAAVKF